MNTDEHRFGGGTPRRSRGFSYATWGKQIKEMAELSIPLRSIVGLAEHLAVLGRTVAAPTPRGDVVGVHLVEVVDPGLVGIVADGVQRAVGFVLAFTACVCLLYATFFVRSSKTLTVTRSPGRVQNRWTSIPSLVRRASSVRRVVVAVVLVVRLQKR